MADQFYGEQQARARRTDPQTSHQAAAAVTPGLPAIQRRVEVFALLRPDGFLDVELVDNLQDLGPSTVRTRRAELVDRNIILDSKRQRTPAGATSPHKIWIHRNFVSDPGPVRPPPAPGQIDALREQASSAAAQCDASAKQMKAEGRTLFAQDLGEHAELFRTLAAKI